MIVGQAQVGGLVQEGGDERVVEDRPSFRTNVPDRAGRHEHADTPFLVQDAFTDQHVDPLGRGGRVDAVHGRQLVGGQHLGFFLYDFLQDVVLDALRDLQVDRCILIKILLHCPAPTSTGSDVLRRMGFLQEMRQFDDQLSEALMDENPELGDEGVGECDLGEGIPGDGDLTDADEADADLRDVDDADSELSDGDEPNRRDRRAVESPPEGDVDEGQSQHLDLGFVLESPAVQALVRRMGHAAHRTGMRKFTDVLSAFPAFDEVHDRILRFLFS